MALGARPDAPALESSSYTDFAIATGGAGFDVAPSFTPNCFPAEPKLNRPLKGAVMNPSQNISKRCLAYATMTATGILLTECVKGSIESANDRSWVVAAQKQ